MSEGDEIIRFGSFELNLSAGELRKSGTRIKLQQQPFQILQILVKRPGEIVSRETIQAQLWPGGVHVDFENAINSSVRKLREALGDNADNPRFVETLTRRGYRFIAPVGPVPSRDVSAPVPGEPADSSPRSAPDTARPGRPVVLRAVRPAALVLAAVSLMVVAGALRSDRKLVPNDFTVTPLTTYPGVEIEPSFSPDGTQVAFAWNGAREDNFDIYVKSVGAGDPLRLTKNVAADRSPAWSPDGQWIAFLRELDERESALMLVPALGGAETEIARVGIAWINTWDVPGRYLAWSGDSKSLFVLNATSPLSSRYTVTSVSIATRQQRTVAVSKEGTMGPGGLSVSPDGKALAYTRSVQYGPRQLYLVPLTPDFSDREEKAVINEAAEYEPCALDWTPDGQHIVFSSCGSGVWWRAVSGTGKAIRLAGLQADAGDLAIARSGNRLVYSQGGDDRSIWRLSLSGERVLPPTRFIASTRNETLVAFSPSGDRIAFQSNRSGAEEIWLCNRDASSPVQLTRSGRGFSGSPQWSPDGRSIAFDRSQAGGAFGIYRIDADGGEPVALVRTASENVAPAWSRDGAWIYFSSDRTGRYEIWKVPAQGGAAVQVTRNGGSAPQESPDGRELYYQKALGQKGGLWKAPVQGGNEVKVLESVHQRDFAIASDGIYYVDREGKGAEIHFFHFRTGRDKKLASLFARCPGFALSPDGSSLLFAQVDRVASDLMLVENFR